MPIPPEEDQDLESDSEYPDEPMLPTPADPDLSEEIDTREPHTRRPSPTKPRQRRKAPAGATGQPAANLAPPLCAVPSLFTRRTVNLLIGSSGNGKTSLILSQLESYLSTTEHLFLESPLDARYSPEQCGMLVCMRNMEAAWNHIQALDLAALSDPLQFPIHDWKPTSGETITDALYRHHDDMSRAARSPVHFLVIEGIQNMLEGPNASTTPKIVRDFFVQLNQFCIDRDCTILGTVGMAKMRKGECYPNLSDRIYGTVTWGHESSTLIGIEKIHQHLPEERRPTRRRVVVQAKSQKHKSGSPDSVLYMDFDERNRLVVIEPTLDIEESPSYQTLDRKLDEVAPGDSLTRDDILRWGEKEQIGMRTVERWIQSRAQDDMGMLEKLGNNRTRVYRKPYAN